MNPIVRCFKALIGVKKWNIIIKTTHVISLFQKMKYHSMCWFPVPSKHKQHRCGQSQPFPHALRTTKFLRNIPLWKRYAATYHTPLLLLQYSQYTRTHHARAVSYSEKVSKLTISIGKSFFSSFLTKTSTFWSLYQPQCINTNAGTVTTATIFRFRNPRNFPSIILPLCC